MPAGWQITGAKYGEHFMPNGDFENVAFVNVLADDGASHKLIVPLTMYTPENVKALGDQWLSMHNAVLSLNSM